MVTRTRPLVAVLILTLVAVFGSPALAQPSAADGAPVVTLIDAGAEPREARRYQFTVGETESVVMDMAMSMGMSIGGQGMPETALPTMRMTMSMTIQEDLGDGSFRYGFVLDGVELLDTSSHDPMMVGAMQAQMDGMVGMNGTAVIDQRGFTSDLTVEMPANADPNAQQMMTNMEQSMGNISAPLPEEPIGAGARWTVVTNLDSAGIPVSQTAEMTLGSVEGTVLSVTSAITQAATSQEIAAPGMPPGTVLRLESLDSSGSSTSTVDLTKLVPTATISMHTAMETTATSGGQTQAIDMTIGLEMSMQPAAE